MPSKVKQNRLVLDLGPGLTHFDRDTTTASCRRESISLCRSKLSCPCGKCVLYFCNLLLNCTVHYANLIRILRQCFPIMQKYVILRMVKKRHKTQKETKNPQRQSHPLAGSGTDQQLTIRNQRFDRGLMIFVYTFRACTLHRMAMLRMLVLCQFLDPFFFLLLQTRSIWLIGILRPGFFCKSFKSLKAKTPHHSSVLGVLPMYKTDTGSGIIVSV